MYKRPKKCTNLDACLLWFLRQKRACFAIFGTQLRAYCDFPKSERITGSMMENLITKSSAIFGIYNTSQKKARKIFGCPIRQLFTSDDLNVWKFQQQRSQKKDQRFSLCWIRQFLPQIICMFGIPATMVLNWLVLNLYPFFFLMKLNVH